ncbi:MAG: triose-phosphate isomerase [Pseudomonadota bacterium]
MNRKRLIAGNWKMNGSEADARALARGIAAGINGETDVLICPPFPYLSIVKAALQSLQVTLGAQNVSQQANGAYTGEVSAAMLSDLGCSYVIVGHSERRQLYGEDSALVSDKARVVAAADMRPIICIGETLEEREGGQTRQVIETQLAAVFAHPAADYGELVLAYEPVWAIGTGKTASPEQAQEVHAFVRELLGGWDAAVAERCRILYGGSVKADNAANIFAMEDVDGGLVGGASLQTESFVAIANAV